ncbi:alkyl hydroperoxide reductase [Citricoccus zhacaiensis]|uniref:Alkyl hydroperoxide reductase n=1 Tax=Citricoccus zhacaiensis TaxID=489142 RepID=A0ABQ2LS01_9MICC|nr:TlpA disulfide reductase family protein [Citricoccus zhacaiensis]GGO42469.1 alkyl hydroperoxide reductase [Citricoccus zhacaiensis]
MRRGKASVRTMAATAIGVLVLAGCQHGADDGPRVAPPLSGLDLQGNPQDIAELAGEVVVVNAWASWCGPCRDEMPVLEAAQDAHGDDGLHVLGINTRDRTDAAQDLVAETGVSFPSVVDTEGTLAVEWGISGMPQTFVVDRDGTIAAHRFGAVDQDWIDSVIVPLVHGTSVSEEEEP